MGRISDTHRSRHVNATAVIHLLRPTGWLARHLTLTLANILPFRGLFLYLLGFEVLVSKMEFWKPGSVVWETDQTVAGSRPMDVGLASPPGSRVAGWSVPVSPTHPFGHNRPITSSHPAGFQNAGFQNCILETKTEKPNK